MLDERCPFARTLLNRLIGTDRWGTGPERNAGLRRWSGKLVSSIGRDWVAMPFSAWQTSIAATAGDGSLLSFGAKARKPITHARHGFQVNDHFICRISRRKLVFQLADFLRVLTLPFDLLAITSPSAKRRTTAMFLAPLPAR
jgi:hypothetical protein